MLIEIAALFLGALAILAIYTLFLMQKYKYFKEIQKLTHKLQMQEENTIESMPSSENLQEVDFLKSEILRLKNTLSDTKIIAQGASALKNNFLTNIRHEIRTPMNSILSFSKMIEEESTEPTIRSYSYNVFKSGHYLLNLLNNIIEMSEIDSGKFKINTSAINVKVFIDLVVEVHRHEAKRKGLTFTLEIDENMPESIMIDVQRVKEILNNLVDNAIKFTKKGEIKFTVVLDSFDESINEAEISFIVKDTGLGIENINQEKIFQIFQSKDINSKAEYQGSGLGLSINKRLAVLMDGNLSLKSEYKKGSTFTLSLDNVEIVLANKSYEINDSTINFSTIKPNSTIVVIDKEQKTLDMVVNSFKNTQVKVLAYNNSKDVMAILQSEKVNLILIDIEMLSMDESAVGRVINRLSEAPVISLVENRLNNIVYHKDGVKPLGHLKKPLRKIDLFRIALKIVNSQDMKVVDGKIKEVKAKVNENLSFEKDSVASQQYFKNISKEMDILLDEALSTNNLNSIEHLVAEIHKLSILYKIESLEVFAKKFLEKIDSFDIEGMDTMLREYDEESRKFKEKMSL